MDKAIDILHKRYDELSEGMDAIVDAEVELEAEGGYLTPSEKRYNDRRWHEQFIIRCEIASLIEELEQAAKEMR